MGGKKNNKILLSITNAKQSKENNQYQCFYHGKAAMSKENEKNTRRDIVFSQRKTKKERGVKFTINGFFKFQKLAFFFYDQGAL